MTAPMWIPAFGIPQIFTGDGAIGTSGKPTVVWSITMHATTTVARLIDGTDASGTIVWGSTVSAANRHSAFPNGLYCPNGAFLDYTSGTGQIDVTYTTIGS